MAYLFVVLFLFHRDDSSTVTVRIETSDIYPLDFKIQNFCK